MWESWVTDWRRKSYNQTHTFVGVSKHTQRQSVVIWRVVTDNECIMMTPRMISPGFLLDEDPASEIKACITEFIAIYRHEFLLDDEWHELSDGDVDLPCITHYRPRS